MLLPPNKIPPELIPKTRNYIIECSLHYLNFPCLSQTLEFFCQWQTGYKHLIIGHPLNFSFNGSTNGCSNVWLWQGPWRDFVATRGNTATITAPILRCWHPLKSSQSLWKCVSNAQDEAKWAYVYDIIRRFTKLKRTNHDQTNLSCGMNYTQKCYNKICGWRLNEKIPSLPFTPIHNEMVFLS